MSRVDGSQSLDGFCSKCGDKSCDQECVKPTEDTDDRFGSPE